MYAVQGAACDTTESIEGFWKLARWARRRGGVQPTYTPTLHAGNQTYDTPERKAQVLQETLFPPPPEADLSDIPDYEYPEPLQMPAITEKEVCQAVRQAAPNKAPGPDGIPNLTLHHALAIPVFLDHLTNLFNTCLQLGYCPEHFRKSTTVVLRKPGKPDYADPKAYRPIALLNTIRKALEAVIASRISYMVEAHSLLPQTHVGGRRGRSCEHAIHLLLERVLASWRTGALVATLLTLDVSGAFDNTAHKRLIHNLRKRRVPINAVNWIASFLHHRITDIVLMEGATGQFTTDTGIPQGSPLSPILYLFYNADLIDQIHEAYPGKATVTGYIDDICILVWSQAAAANCRRLEQIHKIAEQWEAQHASKFAPAKYGLIHLWQKVRGVPRPLSSTNASTNASVKVQGVEVKPVPTLHYLGVQLDQHLTGMKQIEHAQVKATEMIAALCSIAGSTWEITLSHLHQISTWFIQAGWGFKAAENAARKALESIQHKALYRIAGAFRTTSQAALKICLNILPPMIALERAAKESYLRIATSPLMATLIEIRHSGQRPAPRNAWERRRHMQWATTPDHDPLTSPLERWGRRIAISQNRLEVIHPHVTPPWWSGLESHIAETREDALAAHQAAVHSSADIIAYTDGSLTEQGVGAAVVSPLGCQAVHIGSPATHTIYAAELRGIEMALTQIGNTERGWDIQLYWLPGHEGIYGNECADALAKEAANSPAPNSVEELTLMASTQRALRIEAASAWKSEWAASTHGNSLRRYGKNPQKHQCNYTKAYREPPHQSSFKCKFGRLRWLVILAPLMLWNQLNALVDVVVKIYAMFSSTGSRRELDYRAYLTRPDLVLKAVRFMLETGLLGQFQTLPTTYRVTTTDLGQPAA
ncbi:hypothetical protein SI65_00611 [Aspergillus cristatus]|uniref:Reverse transcriptase domain-containing protein n=1 Tax=Aspergillus cristatus TaxID=573508 RepID=A0A1E3BPY4_ASPCR|nr:hypothetical protein SI65_00611 [Aspergillus cristatus]